MNETTYRENLLEGYCYLGAVKNVAFENAINIAMSGELKDFDDTIEVGESYHIELEHLKGTNDNNLNSFIDLCEYVDNMMMNLKNINAISDEEIEKHLKANS